MNPERDKQTLEREWFSESIQADWEREGAGTTVDGIFSLGGYSRMSDNCGFIVHEMSHLVEIDDRRAHMNAFGLRYKRVVVFPPSRYSDGIYPEPLTPQGVARECRVIAISEHIFAVLGWTTEEIASETASTISTLHYLADWYNVPGKTDDARRAWCHKKVIAAHKHWPIEVIRAEWWRKTVLIGKRLARRQRRSKVET